MGVFLAVLMASAMLIIAPGLSFYFDVVPKATLILCGAAALLAASGLDGRGLWVRPRGAWALGALLVAALASLAVSTALSVRPALSLFGTNWRFFGAAPQFAVFAIAWALAVRCGGRPERVRLVLRGAAAAGALSAAYGIAQYFGYDPLLPAASYRIGEGIWAIVRPPGTLGHAGYFATWLVCACFLSVTLAAMETRRRARALSAGAAGLAAAAVFLTGARAGMLALVAGGCAWVLWRRPRLRRRALLAVCAAALAGAVFYVSPAGWMLRSRARWFSEDRWGGARLLLWRDALKMGAHAPLAGYGPEMFEAAFPRFESAELARAYPDFAYESPHNMFLDALASQGLPGALIVAGVCWLGFRAAWRLRSVRRAEAAGLAAALAGIVMSQQFTAFTLPTALAFYGAVALAVALASEGDRGADDRLSSSAGLLPPRNPGAIAGHRRRWPAPLWTFAASA
jgi:O-antigen ligase